eukprot:6184234-Pleurochrysis_carterae.AAC.2
MSATAAPVVLHVHAFVNCLACVRARHAALVRAALRACNAADIYAALCSVAERFLFVTISQSAGSCLSLLTVGTTKNRDLMDLLSFGVCECSCI